MDHADVDLTLEALALQGQPVVTQPENLPAIPYEKQNRGPEALLKLEADTAAATRIDAQRLVLVAGVVGAGGRQGALYEVRLERGSPRVLRYVIAYRSGDQRLHLVEKHTRPAAMERWEDVRQSIQVITDALAAAEVLTQEGSVMAANFVIDERSRP